MDDPVVELGALEIRWARISAREWESRSRSAPDPQEPLNVKCAGVGSIESFNNSVLANLGQMAYAKWRDIYPIAALFEAADFGNVEIKTVQCPTYGLLIPQREIPRRNREPRITPGDRIYVLVAPFEDLRERIKRPMRWPRFMRMRLAGWLRARVAWEKDFPKLGAFIHCAPQTALLRMPRVPAERKIA